MKISKTTVAAFKKTNFLSGLCEISENGFLILCQHLGSNGNLDNDISAISAGPVAAHAMMAFLGLEMLSVTEINQGVQILDAFKPYIAAAATIAAIGAAVFNKFFTVKAFAAGATVAAFNKDFSFIKEFHSRFFQKQKPANVRRAIVGIK